MAAQLNNQHCDVFLSTLYSNCISLLLKHKFQHNFLDTINPLCSCCLEVESTCHYLLRCSSFACFRKSLLDNIINLIGTVSNLSDDNLVQLLLYGDKIYSLMPLF